MKDSREIGNNIKNSNSHSWQNIFLEREKELNWLKQNWKDVFNGKGTRICILRGESGFGKTRVVQEFYSWVSRTETYDPHNYWPDNLRRYDDNLRVNPQFDQSTKRNSIKIPWLWWGVRWEDPLRRNSSESEPCAFINYSSAIAAHKKTITTELKKQGLLKDATSLVADVITPFFESLSGYGAIKSIADAFEIGLETLQEHKQNMEPVAVIQQITQEKHVERIMNFFDYMLDERVISEKKLPIILALDDVHWIDSLSLTNILTPLIKKSVAKKRPLMIIATSWESEWHNQSIQGTESFPKLFNSIISSNHEIGSIQEIGQITQLNKMIYKAYEGFTDSQVSMILDKCDGNVRLLLEVLLWFKSDSRKIYFKNGDISSELNEKGEQKLNRMRFKLEQFQKERFESLKYEIQLILGVASILGINFISELLFKSLENISEWSTYRNQENNLITEAIKPHSILSEIDNGQYIFRHKVFYQIAKEYIQLDEQNIHEQVSQNLRNIGSDWLKRSLDLLMPFSQKENFYLLLLRLQESTSNLEGKLPLAKLLIAYTKEGYYQKAELWYRKKQTNRLYSHPVSLEILPFSEQKLLIQLAIQLMEYESALIYINSIRKLIRKSLSKSQEGQRLSYLLTGHEASVLLKQGKINEALKLYKTCLTGNPPKK